MTPCSTHGAETRTSCSTSRNTPVRARFWSPAPNSASAPPASTPCGRCTIPVSAWSIAPSFADIFYGNTAKNGVLAAIMPQESVELLWKLLEEEPGREMTVSLETRTVTCGDVTLPFEVNDYVRWRLMNGYDDIDLTLQHEDDIAAYEKMRAEKFPFKPKTIPAKHWAEERIESAREPEDADWTGPLTDRGII